MVTPKGSIVNGGRDTPSFCPTLQVLDMSTLADAADVNPVSNVCGGNLITGLTSAAPPTVDISSTCKVGQKHGVSFPLLTCSLRREHPGYCTAEAGNPGGSYELSCICRRRTYSKMQENYVGHYLPNGINNGRRTPIARACHLFVSRAI